MLKSSILNYHTSIRNSIKSSWLTLGIISAICIPLAIFFFLVLFENETAALIMRFYPPSPRQGITFYLDIVYLTRLEILWLGFFALLSLVLMNYPLEGVFAIRSKTKATYYMMLIASAFVLATAFINREVFEDFPNSSDEYAYLFQAEMFSRGKLWERAHDLPDFFYINNIAQHEGIQVSRFPPGWPLILSSAFELGLSPALVNPFLGVVTLLVFYFFVKRYYDAKVAVWSTLAVGLSGFYVFNAASYFSHTSCLLMVLLFVFSIYLYREKNNFIFGLLAGFFLAFVVTIRYYTAFLIFIPFLVYLIVEYRWRVVTLFFWMAVGSIPCVGYLLWYDYSITGDPFLPVTMWAYPEEQIGFVRGHTFLKGLEHLIRHGLLFIYWVSPGLLILYIVLLWRKVRSAAERVSHPEDYAFAVLAIGYFFYYEIGGNQYGPRFLFEAFPFLVVFVVSHVLRSGRNWAMAILIACLVYPIIKMPVVAYRKARIIDQRQNVYDLVEEEKITNALVFISSPTSPLRPMPVDDLTRNDPTFINDVMYVLSFPKINDQLMDYYPDRSVYEYVRDVDDVNGKLIRIR